MAFSTYRSPPLPDPLDEALRDARVALERLRATLATAPLSGADPTRQPADPVASGAVRARVCR